MGRYSFIENGLIPEVLYNSQKQPPGMFYKKICFKKFIKIRRVFIKKRPKVFQEILGNF